MAKPSTATVFSYNPRPVFYATAHRGGEGLWPSNTLYAFERALHLGVDVLEIDIHLTADGTLVIRHDPTVNSTTDGIGAIRDLTLAQIKALDAGYTWTEDGGQSFPFRGLGITIPTLEEAFQAFPGAFWSIDIKPDDPGVVDLFCRTLRQYDKLKQVVVGSFHDPQLRRFRRLCPEVANFRLSSLSHQLRNLSRFSPLPSRFKCRQRRAACLLSRRCSMSRLISRSLRS